MSKPIPYVESGHLHDPGGAIVCAVPSSPPMRTGWVDWLGDPANRSFRFVGLAGTSCTVIKELRAGRSGIRRPYWYAHRHVFGKLKRVYLGKSETLTLRELEVAAARLAQLEMSETGAANGGV